MIFVTMSLEIIGALGLFMFGMNLSSNGIQKAAGDKLQKVMNFMTGNRFMAVMTGFIITVLIQSSSASTVMIVSFVNAGIMSLVQAIGCIMGANIGTTVTAWVVAILGVGKFKIIAFAVPIVGIGFFMSLSKKNQGLAGWGEALMGFGFIFLGLEAFSGAIPDPSAEVLLFLAQFQGWGYGAILICLFVGILFTMLVNASSATIAIVIPLAVKGVITFEMACALVLGANIGTTLDAFLVSIGASINAKRAAWAHILFNVFGAIWATILFQPLIWVVDFITPGDIQTGIAAHIAMYHTMFNLITSFLLILFLKQYAKVISWIIKDEKEGEKKPYHVTYVAQALHALPEFNLIYARSEVSKMASVTREMYDRFRIDLKNKPKDMAEEVAEFKKMENFADEMQIELSRFLNECARMPLADQSRNEIALMLRAVDELEHITDVAFHLILLLERADAKKMEFDKNEVESLAPYSLLVDNALHFVESHINAAEHSLTDEELAHARDLEDKIDAFKSQLKKMARKRLEGGADVKTELLFIDIVRNIEKIGDAAYSITQMFESTKV